jgi:peptidoglycan DL-endopeptidase CwlO
MLPTTSERGQAAIAVVGVLLVLVLAAIGAGGFLRASLARESTAGTADGAAFAAAALLRDRVDDLLPRRDLRTGRSLPPRLTRSALDALARAAAARTARAGGAEPVSLQTSDGPRGLPLTATVIVRAAGPLPAWLGVSSLRSTRLARASAGLDYAMPEVAPDRFRTVDLRGLAGVAAVVAGATAQLGWPYLWGGESRAEGGFDCSGLVDYALAAAGFPVGRPTAAGLQTLTLEIPLAATRAGDLVFVGTPAHHVGLVVGPGLAIEAPHRGAVVHYEPLARGGWTSAGRLAELAAAPSVGEPVPDWVPVALRADLLAASRADDLPVTLLAAQIEVESGFDPSSVSAAGARGLAQFMPGTWAGSWNPWRAQSPLDPAAAIHAQARYLRRLVDRANGDLGRALAVYHDGSAASASATWPPVTRAYVSAILRRFGGPALLPSVGDATSMGAPAAGIPVLRLVSLDQATPNG